MNNILENNNLNLSLADATYLRWYEITNALSHTHMDAILCGLQQQLTRELRRDGGGELTCSMVKRCFRDVTQKLASSPTLRQFESSVHIDEAA
jgi:hypothetical protein